MEGDGVDLQGRRAHTARLGSTGWVKAAERPTLPVCLGRWRDGFPAWLISGWREPSPVSPDGLGRHLTGQRILVIAPG